MPSAMGYTPGDGSVLEWNGVDAAKVRAIVDQVVQSHRENRNRIDRATPISR